MKEIEEIAVTVNKHIMPNEDEKVEIWRGHSIYMVPAHTKAASPEASTLKEVSMGPYHHGKEHLKLMEVHKKTAARRFIKVSRILITDYIKVLWEVMQETMVSYSQLDQFRMGENRGRFLELLLIDGCFLLEMLRVYNLDYEGYDNCDPLFSDKTSTLI